MKAKGSWWAPIVKSERERFMMTTHSKERVNVTGSWWPHRVESQSQNPIMTTNMKAQSTVPTQIDEWKHNLYGNHTKKIIKSYCTVPAEIEG